MYVHQANEFGAKQREWHERDFKRSVEFHAMLLAMPVTIHVSTFKLFSAPMAGFRGGSLAVSNVSKSNAVSRPWRKWQSSSGNLPAR